MSAFNRGNDRNLCRACGLRFNSTEAFGKHRAGVFDVAAPRYGRRCLSADELTHKGFAPNADGFWRKIVGLENAPRRLAA